MHKQLVLGKSVKNLSISSKDGERSSLIVIPIPRIRSKECRKCERTNYIPHRSINTTQSWYDNYDSQIYDMYRIAGRLIEERYPKIKVDWSNPKYYNAFNKLLNHCSSNHIIFSSISENEELSKSKEVHNYDKGWEKQKDN